MNEAVRTSETSAYFNETILRYIPDGCHLQNWIFFVSRKKCRSETKVEVKKGKAVPLHAMEALGGRGGIAPTHS
jgi:hypothetical protein